MSIFQKPIKEIYATFPAEESRLEEVRTFVQTVTQDTGLASKDLTGIQLAIEEACTNVIRHAYLYGPGTIRLKIVLGKDAIVFSIYDTGRQFNFGQAAGATPDLKRYIATGRKGGLGLYLIQKIMDDVSYRSHNGTNEMRLTKKIPRKVPLSMRPVRGLSVRVKFSLLSAAIVLAIMAAVFFFFDHRTTTAIYRADLANVEQLARTVAAAAEDPLLSGSDLELMTVASGTRRQHPELSYLVVVDTGGVVLADPDRVEQVLTAYPLPPGLAPRRFWTPQVVSPAGQETYHTVAPISIGGTFRGFVHVGLAKKTIEAEVVRARYVLILICLVGLLVGFLAIWTLAQWFVKPIQKLTEGVLRIGQGELDATLPVEGKDEFGEIAKAFNDIALKFKQSQKTLLQQERLQKEIEVAQEIQRALLPRQFPEVEGYDIATIYRAAKDVGGDYYDFFWIDEKTMGIVVADVSGKGVPGSLVMTMIRTAIRLEARGNRSPVEILSRVNAFVADDVKKGMFITIFLVVLDSVNRTITYTSAGHNPMILYRKEEDRAYFLNPRGIPLGISLPDDLSFEETLAAETVRLKKDDILVIYTDGITEAMNAQKEQFGTQRLLDFIRANCPLAAEEFAEKFNDELSTFTGDLPQHDDITLVAVKEQLVADKVVFATRKRLLDLVAVDGKTVREACAVIGVAPTTYYRYKRLYDQFGPEGLKARTPRLGRGEEMRQVSIDDRQKILSVVALHPEYGPARVKSELASERFGHLTLDEEVIYDELVRLRLNTKLLRLEFAERTKGQLPATQAHLIDLERQKEKEQGEAERAAAERIAAAQRQEAAAQQAERQETFLTQLREQGLESDDLALLAMVAGELKQVAEDEKVEKLFRLIGEKIVAEKKKKAGISGSPRPKVLDWQRLVTSHKPVTQKPEAVTVPEEPGEEKPFNWEEYSRRVKARLVRSPRVPDEGKPE